MTGRNLANAINLTSNHNISNSMITSSAIISTIIILLLSGCSTDGILGGNASSPSGVTPGGLQDINTARELIANDVVPPAETLVAEGMFSQHDLSLESGDCSEPLCIQGALGWQNNSG